MAKLGLQGTSYRIQKPLVPLKPGLCLYLLFNILPGLCEFTPPNRGKKLPTARTFFGEGYIESENCFETLKGRTIE